jgi:hypothetical protein
MSTDVEELLREGMERFTAGVHAPAGLASTAARLRRRRRAIHGAVAFGAAAATAAAAILAAVSAGGSTPRAPGTGTRPSAPAMAGGVPGANPTGPQAHEVAYVVKRVETALTSEHQVFYGQTTSDFGPSSTWVHGTHYRWEEFTGTGCGQVLPNGQCTNQGPSERYLAQGTAQVGGKLTTVYVTYYNREWSGGRFWTAAPTSACSPTGALEMGGPPIPTNHWADFINATLACGAAKATGHVRINGMETIQITGKPVTVRLKPGYARTVREKRVRVRWTLYVDPATYLPVRISGSTATFGGPSASTMNRSVTDVRWLPPTPANIAKAMVTIPPGFHRVSSPANQ